MVGPFVDHDVWSRLRQTAHGSWGQIFSLFHNLQTISVGCCEIVDHPWPTASHVFVLEHGRDVCNELNPPYVEDLTVNMAWASAEILQSAPPSVLRLKLSLANTDNFDSTSTVNELLSIGHTPPLQLQLPKITRLCPTFRGVAGTHGIKYAHDKTGSIGSVRPWINALNRLFNLRYLEFRDTPVDNSDLAFTDMENSVIDATILDWILPKLSLKRLHTLRVSTFLLDIATV
ncbi:hypothetical protein CC86DRAFT_369581 [Ophiobolus disseminans]|uniref:Uncharacterized protein n=1 Tax=Ophiobolus disseminans TaxID=1469910 RepID=A0A6A7A3S4_9PLEO|nr:hypothetical protein CC86DRAFT_369581 [Ophiobolus disseminans]